MNATEIVTEIRWLRGRLDVLERELSALRPARPNAFAELEGLLEGQSDSSEADIDAVLFRGVSERDP